MDFDEETLFGKAGLPPAGPPPPKKARRFTFQTSHPAAELLSRYADLSQVRIATVFEECFELYSGIMLGRKDRRASPQMAWYPSRIGEALRFMAHGTGLPLHRLVRLAASVLGAMETWEVGLDADPEEGGRVVYCSEPNSAGWSTSEWKRSKVFLGAIDWAYRAARSEQRGVAGFAVEMMLRGLDAWQREQLEED